MKDIGKKYLPIGTVVLLKGGTKRAMITGFCSIEEGNQNVMYDYNGCMYPEGFLQSNQTFLFNHDQIEKICYMGLADDNEEKEFKKNLNKILKTINEN